MIDKIKPAADPKKAAGVPDPGMMGDGTEEQSLNQPGNLEARIAKKEVEAAFGGTKK